VLPGLAAVGGAVDAVARLHVAADVRLARADVDDVGVGRGHGDGAEGGNGLVVEDGLPGQAAVGGLPQAAAGCGGDVGVRVAGDAHGATDAAAGGRADGAEFEVFERASILVGLVGPPGRCQGEEDGRDRDEVNPGEAGPGVLHGGVPVSFGAV